MDGLDKRIQSLEDRVEYLESEFTDKGEFYELDNRINKIENEVSYRDVYIYVSVFYIIYVTCKQLNNMV
jgi:tetrahydromethanopterin S-methyltransferase subunit G